VREYYLLLRSILKSQPHLRPCLTRCRHCRIFFLSDPRNARRKNLGCSFGCKEAHRKRRSTERSVEYYRDSPGKIKKAIQNARRRKQVPVPVIAPAPSTESLPCPEPVLEHVRMVVSLIEGRPVTPQEILEMLARILRQHRMVRRRKIDQAVDWLNANPP
jgi:hypothetical protein